jgi:lipid II:glycine glycyltransferase (peptidoglycan interpeptide bridge formation enzyme)
MSAVSVRLARSADRDRWDRFVLEAAGGDLLQTWGWGELKQQGGWQVHRLLAEHPDGATGGALQVLVRRGPGGVGFAYGPRGPALAATSDVAPAAALVDAAAALARRHRCLVLKLDPEWRTDDPEATALLRTLRLRPSRYDVQHRKTYLVDLGPGAEAVLARLKPSTRHHIRQAERLGVQVEIHSGAAAESSVARFQPLFDEAASRGGFVGRDLGYHRAAVRCLGGSCPVAVLLASVNGEDAAAMIAVAAGPRLCYLFGGSSPRHARLHPSYLLHWRAIEWGWDRGCRTYDMWGVPNHEDPTAPGAGYFEFKTRWNGEVVRHHRCQEVALWPRLGPLPRLAERLALRGRPLLT